MQRPMGMGMGASSGIAGGVGQLGSYGKTSMPAIGSGAQGGAIGGMHEMGGRHKF